MEIKVVRQILEWNEDCHKEVQEELNEYACTQDRLCNSDF